MVDKHGLRLGFLVVDRLRGVSLRDNLTTLSRDYLWLVLILYFEILTTPPEPSARSAFADSRRLGLETLLCWRLNSLLLFIPFLWLTSALSFQRAIQALLLLCLGHFLLVTFLATFFGSFH